MIRSLFCVCCMFLGCCKSSSSITPVEYKEYVVENTHLCSEEELNSTFTFSYPSEMLLYDTVIIVKSPQASLQWFHLFSKTNGAHITSFGSKGRGPGEMIVAGSTCVDPMSGQLNSYDRASNKVVSYDLEKILRREQNYNTEVKLDDRWKKPDGLFVVDDVLYMDSLCVLRTRSDHGWLCKVEHGTLTQIQHDCPVLVRDKEENQSVWSYETKWRIRPDAKKIVIATYIGALMQIIDSDRSATKKDTLLAFAPPIYSIAEGATPKWVTHTNETIFGFEDVFVTNDKIYAIRSNPDFDAEKQDHTRVYVFDWSGHANLTYLLKDWVFCGVADEETNSMYGIAQRGDNFVLMKYSFSKTDSIQSPSVFGPRT